MLLCISKDDIEHESNSYVPLLLLPLLEDNIRNFLLKIHQNTLSISSIKTFHIDSSINIFLNPNYYHSTHISQKKFEFQTKILFKIGHEHIKWRWHNRIEEIEGNRKTLNDRTGIKKAERK